jgi:hypothetical protein
MAKRGRPRKPGARFPSGDLKPVEDRGTSELQQRRIAALETASAALDPRTSFTWGILYARRLIATHHYLAGLSLARDWHALYPHRTPPACLGNLVPVGEGTIAIPTEESCVPDDQGKLCGRCQACFARRAKERVDEAEKEAERVSPRGWMMLTCALLFDQPPDFTDIARDRLPAEWDQDGRDHDSFLRAAEAIRTVYAFPVARDKDGIEERTVELYDSVQALRALRVERLRREAEAGAPKSHAQILAEARQVRVNELRAARLKAEADKAAERRFFELQRARQSNTAAAADD